MTVRPYRLFRVVESAVCYSCGDRWDNQDADVRARQHATDTGHNVVVTAYSRETFNGEVEDSLSPKAGEVVVLREPDLEPELQPIRRPSYRQRSLDRAPASLRAPGGRLGFAGAEPASDWHRSSQFHGSER